MFKIKALLLGYLAGGFGGANDLFLYISAVDVNDKTGIRTWNCIRFYDILAVRTMMQLKKNGDINSDAYRRF